MATGTKAPVKPDATTGDVPGVDVEALQAELAEVRAASAAALEQGQQMLAAAMALVQQGGGAAPQGGSPLEPAKDDPRRNLPEKGFEPVVFRAKGAMLRVVRTPATRFTAPNGEAQHAAGINYDFGENRGDFTALNSNVAEFLRSRPAFNLEFWEVGSEPHAAPDPSIVLDKVLTALMELDTDALEALKEKEMASHNRKVVLDQINAAQKKIAGASA